MSANNMKDPVRTAEVIRFPEPYEDEPRDGYQWRLAYWRKKRGWLAPKGTPESQGFLSKGSAA